MRLREHAGDGAQVKEGARQQQKTDPPVLYGLRQHDERNQQQGAQEKRYQRLAFPHHQFAESG
jgi:hypothetical protein